MVQKKLTYLKKENIVKKIDVKTNDADLFNMQLQFNVLLNYFKSPK